jgi:hypothetical protein
MANVVVSAIATFNGKALKKGQKDISTFDKQVKKLGRTFAVTFSAYQLLNFSKKAVQAFIADEKAAKSLEQQLKNTGYQFSGPAVEMYIANLQKTTGVLDDQLRPAFQQLLTVTGSLTTSQDALNTALNISAATGKSLTEVTSALSRGYAGNTTGLSRLGAGLNKALLKTGDMNAIMTELNKKFAGQSAARLTTYAGKIDLLTASAANAEEIIGKALLDALTRLGDDNTITGLTKDMENFATATGEVIVGLGVMLSKLKLLGNIPGVDISVLKNLPYVGPLVRAVEGLRTIGRENTASQFNTVGRASPTEIATQLKLLKAKKDELALLNKKNAADKNVEELKKKFDIERIGLTVALNAAVDEETKLRIRAQLAILDNNDALAKKILEEMKAAEAAKALADAANKAAMALGTFDPARFRMGENKDLGNDTAQLLAALAAMAGLSAGMIPKGLTGGTSKAAETLAYGQSYSDISRGTLGGSVFDPSFVRRGESQDLQITVDVSQTGDRFAALIAESLQIAQKSGISYGIAGGL